MPGQHSAAISYKMMKTLGDTKVIGPLINWAWVTDRNSSSKIFNIRTY
jgi:phosphotransacetylase